MKNIKKSLLVIVIVLLACGCGSVPTTKDGKEAIITFEKGDNKKQISADDLYNVLKQKYGFDEVLGMIDNYIFETEFKDYKETAEKYSKSYLDGMIKNYESEEAFLSVLRQNTNYKTIDEYKHYIYLSYMQSHAIEEYSKSLITDKQIENYYEKRAKENIDIYQILVTPEVTDKMTESEKTKATDKAKKEVEDIIAKINKSSDKLKTFKELAKNQSDDNATKTKGGSLGYINEFTLGNEYDELIKAAYTLKDGESSNKVITTELGYHVIYRNATKEKSKLDNIKNDIKELLANELMASDKNFNITTMKYYRELYNLKIVDSELDTQYRNYMNELIKANNEVQQENNTKK